MTSKLTRLLTSSWSSSKLCVHCGTKHTLRYSIIRNFHSSNTKRLIAQRQQKHLSTSKDTDKYLELGDEWQSVVGLEIHAQIFSKSKLFSGAGTIYAASTNSQVSLFDAAHPGTLPVLNRRCVDAGIKTARALDFQINMMSRFDRKHYFYADLPAGYQITQQKHPLASDGYLTYVSYCTKTKEASRRNVRLIQLQLEQDSGKSLHDDEMNISLIDLNRAGVGLMEIVTAPDFTSGDEAVSFVRDLRDILVTIETCDGKMEEGSFRVDANISVNKPGNPLGVRTEVKNLNSLSRVRNAINYEIKRQIEILENGGQVVNETRSFDQQSGETVLMRDKEKVLDYRFMPEPNLPPLIIYNNRESVPSSLNTKLLPNVVILEEIEVNTSELPEKKRQKLETDYKLTLDEALQIVRLGLFDLFELIVKCHKCDPVVTSLIVRTIYLPFLEKRKLKWQDSPIEMSVIAEIVNLYHSDIISDHSVNVILLEKANDPEIAIANIIEQHNLIQVSLSELETVVEDVLSNSQKLIRAYKRGKTIKLLMLTQKVLKTVGGRAREQQIQKMLLDRLKD